MRMFGRILVAVLLFAAFAAAIAGLSPQAGNVPPGRTVVPPERTDVASLPPPERPAVAMRLTKIDFAIVAFDTIAEMTFWVENGNDYAVRDAVVECDFLGASGTTIKRRRETLFETFPARKTKHIAKISYGFIDRQVKSASCRVLDAKR